MFDKILVPLDGSQLAELALAPAFRLAEQFGAELILLRVAVPEPVWAGVPGLALSAYSDDKGELEHEHQSAQAYLHGLQLAWRSHRVPIRSQVLAGAPPESIVAAANSEGADLIVMSTHGRT